MKPSHYIEKVKKSDSYKLLMEEDPKAYLCSVFFLRDFDEGNNETQVDFYSPAKKKIVSFKVDKKIEKTDKKTETLTHKKFIPKPLNENTKMDIDQMKLILTDEMHNRDMTYEIEKILAFLNITDGRAVWNCTGFLKGLGLLQAHVEDKSESVLFMEKKSLFDILKFAGNAPGMMPPGNAMGGLGNNISVATNPTVVPAGVAAQEKPKAEKASQPKEEKTKKKEAKSK